MSVAPLLSLHGLSESEKEAIEALSDSLGRYAAANYEANAYYEAKHVLDWSGVTIPQSVAERLAPVTGAPATVVDVLDERLDFLGWDEVDASDSLGLTEVYDRNELESEGPMAHVDSLIYGVSFARVGTGDDGVPLVTMHSPNATTGIRDAACGSVPTVRVFQR